MKTLLIITLLLCSSFSAYADLQQDVINSDAISFDNVPSGVDGSVQYKLGPGFGSDANFFFDTTNISLGIGTNDPTLGGTLSTMKFRAEAEGSGLFVGASAYSDNANDKPAFFFSRSRGTVASPSALVDGDEVATFLGYGRHSVFFGIVGEILIKVNGTPGATNIPGEIFFRVNDGSALTIPLRIINNRVQFEDAGTKPTCDSNTRGTYWHDQGDPGVKDTVEICAKDAGDAYAWRTLY